MGPLPFYWIFPLRVVDRHPNLRILSADLPGSTGKIAGEFRCFRNSQDETAVFSAELFRIFGPSFMLKRLNNRCWADEG